jgi:hypothetical protein
VLPQRFDGLTDREASDHRRVNLCWHAAAGAGSMTIPFDATVPIGSPRRQVHAELTMGVGIAVGRCAVQILTHRADLQELPDSTGSAGCPIKSPA